jgi:hypothetical protein
MKALLTVPESATLAGPFKKSKDQEETHQTLLESNVRWRPPDPLETFVPLCSSKGSPLQFRFNWRGGKL